MRRVEWKGFGRRSSIPLARTLYPYALQWLDRRLGEVLDGKARSDLVELPEGMAG
jgi:hypothetical protein